MIYRRPPKFTTIEDLENRVEEYFGSCFEPIMNHVLAPDYRPRVDPETKVELSPIPDDYIDVPACDKNGNPKYRMIKQPTIVGLANYLDTFRDVLIDYENKRHKSIEPELQEQFSNTIKRAKELIHEYAEYYLYEGKNQTGAIFSLKNNFGWVDRSESLNANLSVDTDDEKVKTKVDDMFSS